MKIPDYQPMQAAPHAAQAPVRGVTQPTGYGDIAQAGAQVGKMGEAIGEAYQKQQAAFEAKDAADGDTEYRKFVTDKFYGSTKAQPAQPLSMAAIASAAGMGMSGSDEELSARDMGGAEHTPGFLETKGEAAVPAMDDVIKELEDKRKEIAGKRRSPRSKELFEKSSEGVYLGAYNQAKAHTAQQVEEAKDASLKANLAEGLRLMAKDPLNEEMNRTLVAQTSGMAHAMAKSSSDAQNKVDTVVATYAEERAKALIKQADARDDPTLLGAAQLVVNGARKELGQAANDLDDVIKDKKSGAEVQSLAAAIATDSKSDRIFTPLDLDKVQQKLAAVPDGKRKLVTSAMDELIGADARRVKVAKERFVDSATSMYATSPGKFFGTSTANALREVDPDKYLALEDRLRSLGRLARAEGAQRVTLQNSLDASALEDLKAQLEVNPMLDVNKFMQSHPEVSGLKVNHFNAVAAKAAKVYEQGLKPAQDKFAADFVAKARGKMPTFEGTSKQVKDQEAAWRKERYDQAVDIYTDAMDANSGEKPKPDELIKRKAEALHDLPLPSINAKALKTDVKAIIDLGAPPARAPAPPAGISATGQTITDPETGVVYSIMSDKSLRVTPPTKVKVKK